MSHYDVGIMGVWFGCNYGSVVTYYALEKTIESYGKSVLMIHRPRLKADDGRMKGRDSIRFAEEHYHVSESFHVSEIGKLNEMCDTFLLGSDQIWNYWISRAFGYSYFLDFVTDEKRKISYATSFGIGEFEAPPDYAKEAIRCMRRMDSISVREAGGIRICRNTFGVKAVHVLDPVLMCDPVLLEELAEKAVRKEKEPYIATYILDPTPEKREALLHVSQQLGKKLINMLDGWQNLFPENKRKLNLDGTVENLQVEEWLCYFKNSDFVITDSFHGTCMAVLFGKPFIAIGNPERGTSRFESLLGSLNLMERYVETADQIIDNKRLLVDINYDKAYQTLNVQRKLSRQWLEQALNGNNQKSVTTPALKLNSWTRRSWRRGVAFAKRTVKKILRIAPEG